MFFVAVREGGDDVVRGLQGVPHATQELEDEVKSIEGRFFGPSSLELLMAVPSVACGLQACSHLGA